MKCTIKIHMDNAAFADGNAFELARILRDTAQKFEDETLREFGLYDINGNRVGKVMFSA